MLMKRTNAIHSRLHCVRPASNSREVDSGVQLDKIIRSRNFEFTEPGFVLSPTRS